MRKIIFMVLLSIVASVHAYSQTDTNNQLLWSETRKLTVQDFQLELRPETNLHGSFAQFSIDSYVHGFDFLAKNFNSKVKNTMIKSASWIEPNGDVTSLLRYEQTLFDLCEVYTRKFRKELKENKWKIASGLDFMNEINDRIMAEFNKRRMEYIAETNFGSDSEKQIQWEAQIKKELKELNDFALIIK